MSNNEVIQPWHPDFIDENDEMEKAELCELFSMESTLNTLISEYCGYEPTQEIGRQMLKLNSSLLKAMNARKKELGVTEWWGYEDDNPRDKNGDLKEVAK